MRVFLCIKISVKDQKPSLENDNKILKIKLMVNTLP